MEREEIMGNLRSKKIGVKHFGRTIDVTDPCHNKDVWCRLNDVKIKEGDYTCRIWRERVVYEWDGKERVSHVVRIIGIYFNDVVPRRDRMEYIGEIGVDAGLAGFFENKPDYTEQEWKAFCDFVYPKGKEYKEAWIRPEGFFSVSGDGDGCYPVLAAKGKDGEVVALEIHF